MSGADADDGASSRSLGRSAALMSAGTAVSRVLGVVRASVLVTAVGLTSAPANAFTVANTLPNVLYMLIAGGVLNAVLVPQVVRAYRTDGGRVYVDRLLTLAGVLLLALTVVLTLASPLIVRLYLAGDDPDRLGLAVAFALWCVPQVFFYGVYTLLGQVLNARGSFGPYMWAPVVNNVVALTGLVVFIGLYGSAAEPGNEALAGWADGGRVALLAGTATLGVVLQAAVLVVPLRRLGFRYRPRRGWRGVGLGSAGRVAGWTFAALLVGQAGIVVVQRVASEAAHLAGTAAGVPGNMAYSNAFLVFMLPHSLVTVSLVTALFTRMSDHAARGEASAVRADFSYGVRTVSVFTIFATAALAVLALPVVRLLFPSVTPVEAGGLARVIVAMAFGLTALGAWTLVQRVYYAYEDARSLFRIQVAMAAVVALGSWVGTWFLPYAWWLPGAAVALSLQYVVGAVAGSVAVRRRVGGTGVRIAKQHVIATSAALVAALLGWGVSRLFGDLSDASSLVALVVCVLVGGLMAAVYWWLLTQMHVTELADLVGPLLAKVGRTMAPLMTARRGTGTGRAGGGVLDGVEIGQGTLLAGRYRLLEQQPTDLPGAQTWTALDQILDRPVRAVVLREGRVAQAQDAARRAALVADPRLLRVLDVGTHEGVEYTVTEPLLGRDLADLTADGPLSADQARALIGEAAVALEVARRRGVHHLALRPSALHVTPDDRVVVSGLAIDGELTGHGLGDARSTTRADTVGLVGLLYLALTGHWPAPSGTAADDASTAGSAGRTVPAAPLVDGRPVPPSDLVPDVPQDLDTLCTVTLGRDDDGPHSPAELVRELEPWGAVTVGSGVGAGAAAGAGGVGAAAAVAGAGEGDAPHAPAAQDVDVPGDVPGDAQPTTTVPRTPVRSTFEQSGAAAPPPGTPPPAVPPVPTRGQQSRGAVAAGASVPAAATAAGAVSASVVDDGVARPDAAAVRPTPADAWPGRPDRPDGPDRRDVEFTSVLGTPAAALTRTRFDPTRWVLGFVVLAVVVGLFMAYRALTAPLPSIGGGDGVPDVVDIASPEPQESGSASPSGSATDAPPTTSSPDAPPVIASAQQLDPPPDGDENEHPELVDLAIDGDKGTSWYTRWYANPDYGMKDGVGYAVTLEGAATVSAVTVDVNGSGGRVEIRATDPSTPTEGDVLATGSLGPDKTFTFDEPVEAEHIVLWFTQLPQDADGKNRVDLREVSLS